MSSMLWLAAALTTFTLPPSAESLIERARETFSVEKPEREACPEPTGNEIVVCREAVDPDKYSVPSDADLGVVKDEIPRAPDVSGLPDCSKPSTCMAIGEKPRDPLIIDLDAIPEAPPGSDADLIARGLKAER
ncbi:hypothetical protein [Croceibacterium aestuarii]|uniref:hypothetical protein n=1 Tax=Croceibacterium aestuarii TaxID=3064139 RepID=UPI00272E4371|nr:hypothetical protein [Croceibacterium sp. D39]